MSEHRVATFFYGSYINVDVLKGVGLDPRGVETARLSGFDIRIEPLANLVRSDRHSVYGIVASLTHRELEALYAHARDVLGGTYLPEAVLVETAGGKLAPALCYIAPAKAPRPASDDYIDRITRAAREHGFPAWYLDRLESFRPRPDDGRGDTV